MLSHPKPAGYAPTKTTATHARLPHVASTLASLEQAPSKNKPWSSLLSQQLNHRVDLVIPEEGFAAVEGALADVVPPVHWRVAAPLGEFLDGAFFLELVKTGKVMMLSEGIQGVDNIFTILDGELTMYLDRETYERAGLVGKPHGAKGARSGKPRWVVHYDLKAPSMLHGKKGFDRLLYACKNVFAAPLTWLYTTCPNEPSPDTLSHLSPKSFVTRPTASPPVQTTTPPLTSLRPDPSSPATDFEELATDLYEWLSLVRLSSPRVEAADKIDPYLSGYRVPGDDPGASAVRRVSWRGFIPGAWVRDTLVKVLVGVPGKSWVGFSATAFGKGAGDEAECTFFRPPESGGQYLFWEMRRD